ncbi:MAG: hypothetical protein OJF49_003266 [Ktedonobacterales bacterium]|jgi:hypothetical protein|nr:MAG: hypothetical protein OJF49_003266 [Ktedonobacterales bacterium]
MRGTVEIARRFLETRREWLSRSDEGRAHSYLDGMMAGLAWVLEVDLALMNAPKVLPEGIVGLDVPERVRVSQVEAEGPWRSWLVEVPPNTETGWRTEFCAFVLAHEQVVELADACCGALGMVGMPAVLPAAPFGTAQGDCATLVLPKLLRFQASLQVVKAGGPADRDGWPVRGADRPDLLDDAPDRPDDAPDGGNHGGDAA